MKCYLVCFLSLYRVFVFLRFPLYGVSSRFNRLKVISGTNYHSKTRNNATSVKFD